MIFPWQRKKKLLFHEELLIIIIIIMPLSLPLYINITHKLHSQQILHHIFIFLSSIKPRKNLEEEKTERNDSPQNGVLGRYSLLLDKQQQRLRSEPRNVCLRYKGRSNSYTEILSTISSDNGESEGFDRTVDIGRESELVREHCGGDTTARNQRV